MRMSVDLYNGRSHELVTPSLTDSYDPSIRQEISLEGAGVRVEDDAKGSTE
jgi:hypothetical protein